MGKRLFTNNARSTLASGISDVATTLTVATGDGAKFASPSAGDWQDITLDDGVNIEIVHLTARSGDVLTVTRAQEGTTGVAFSTGAKVEARFTAGAANSMVPVVQPFDATAYYPGVPTASAKVLRVPVARAISFPANFSGSYGVASVAATGSTAFDVQKNGSSIGTITFAAAASTATFTTAGGAAQSLAAGDVLAIIAPATPDATLADVGFVLAGTR